MKGRIKHREIIKKYFNTLAKKFVKLGKKETLELVFKKYLGKSRKKGYKVGGNTKIIKSRQEISFLWIFKRHKVIGFKHQISFLNNYPDLDILRRIVVHEFTHFWFNWKGLREKGFDLMEKEASDENAHDNIFYAKVDYFENWLDEKLELPIRKNKGDDWEQHINPLKREERMWQFNPLSYVEKTKYFVGNKILVV